MNYLLDGQAVFVCELKIALIMGRHAHHCAGAVAHQYEVGDPDRNLLAADRVDGVDAGRHAPLLHGFDIGFLGGNSAALIKKCSQFGVVFSRLHGQWVARRHGHVGDAHQRIGPGCEDVQRLLGVFQPESDFCAARFTDPVALHADDFFRPARQLIQIVQQLFGIVGDADKPLLQVFANHRRIAAPADAVHHLFIGQHRMARVAPVHFGLFLIGQTFLHQAGKQPLLPAIIIGVTGGNLAMPVVRESQSLELSAHLFDIGVGPLSRRPMVFDGCIFSRQAEGVPTNRMQYIKALHAFITRYRIAQTVIAHMAHMQVAGGVGEHDQTVVGRSSIIVAGGVDIRLLPLLLPFGFDLLC